jgi:hypothetical protein
MASTPLGGPPAVVTMPGTLPPMPAVARILSRFDRDQLAGFIAVAIDLADAMDPDPDLEDATDLEDDHALSPHAIDFGSDGPGCSLSDQDAGAWVEWASMRGAAKRGANFTIGAEDAEDEEGGGDDAQSEDEPGFDPAHRRWANRAGHGAGCKISDDDHADEAEHGSDDEREQMADDVPMLPVVTLDHNIFTDQRQPLGLSNLQTSFRSNANPVRSADSGRVHQSTGWARDPGAPV